MEPTVITGLWATFIFKVLAIFSEIPWRYGKVSKPLLVWDWFVKTFNKLVGVTIDL